MSAKTFSAVLLCAGKGTRFKSDLIKVLHPFLGTSMLQIAVETMSGLDPESIILVIGHQKDRIRKEPFRRPVQFAVQERQLGTANALLAAREFFAGREETNILVMNGDLPLVRGETLRPFLDYHLTQGNALTFLVADLDNPFGFGRLVHGRDGIIRIIEEKDATPEQKKIKESNLGVYLFRAGDAFAMLPRVGTDNAKGEYYLTDMIEIMMKARKKTGYFKTEHSDEFIGVNDRHELALAADVLRMRKNRKLAESGVTLLDPSTTWIDLGVEIGPDTVIHPSVVIEGETRIGGGCRIHPFVRIADSVLGEGSEIGSFNHLDKRTLPARTKIPSTIP
jgi:bifunctional UDP-N-acetylglucosamine pyrophosphorylase/glucosamine-1-phosphate N-acetyltransferase